MNTFHTKLLAVSAVALALSGCGSTGGGGNYQVENATGQPLPHHVLADEVFLDGTGPTARRLAQMPSGSSTVVERRDAEPVPAGAPTRAIVRTRPTALEPHAASSTTGSRHSSSASGQPQRAYSEEWWAKQRQEDARLNRVVNICRGC